MVDEIVVDEEADGVVVVVVVVDVSEDSSYFDIDVVFGDDDVVDDDAAVVDDDTGVVDDGAGVVDDDDVDDVGVTVVVEEVVDVDVGSTVVVDAGVVVVVVVVVTVVVAAVVVVDADFVVVSSSCSSAVHFVSLRLRMLKLQKKTNHKKTYSTKQKNVTDVKTTKEKQLLLQIICIYVTYGEIGLSFGNDSVKYTEIINSVTIIVIKLFLLRRII